MLLGWRGLLQAKSTDEARFARSKAIDPAAVLDGGMLLRTVASRCRRASRALRSDVATVVAVSSGAVSVPVVGCATLEGRDSTPLPSKGRYCRAENENVVASIFFSSQPAARVAAVDRDEPTVSLLVGSTSLLLGSSSSTSGKKQDGRPM